MPLESRAPNQPDRDPSPLHCDLCGPIAGVPEPVLWKERFVYFRCPDCGAVRAVERTATPES